MKYAGVLLFLFVACRPAVKQPAAIKDFRKELQPLLTEIVTRGYSRTYDGDTLARAATLAELQWLERGEHPLLRAAACFALLHREEADHLSVINHHLDDTALIAVDRGEWGLAYKMVSDEVLLSARWKTEADRRKTTDSVFMRHDNLEAAYFASSIVDARPEYYPFIKEMAQRSDFRFEFERKERALYGLARFRKRTDIPLIKQILLSWYGRVGYTSLRLLLDFPDTSYMDIFNGLYPRWLNRQFCSSDEHNDAVNEFFDALASYRSDSSAKILTAILDRRPFSRCVCDSSGYKATLMRAIWNNPCPAYLPLRRRIEGKVREMERRDSMDRIALDDDTPHAIDRKPEDEPLRWW